MVWKGVTSRFSQFDAELLPTTLQQKDGETKWRGICRVLTDKYYSDQTALQGFPVGSWLKDTIISPPSDLDVFFPLPHRDFLRVDALAGNKQSALLGEFKRALAAAYPQTDMRADGQVVQIGFNTLMVELLPAVPLTSGKYYLPDTNDGGRWRIVDPQADFNNVDRSDAAMNANTRRLVRMMKQWRNYCSVPLKSFQIELLAVDFLAGYAHSQQSYFYHDWFVRDFLKFLLTRVNGIVVKPGTFDVVDLGDGWKSRAETALARAEKACWHEYQDETDVAGDEWRKIFGTRILKHV